MLDLVQPTPSLRDSYRQLVREFDANGETPVPFVLAFDHGDFDRFLARLDECAHGIGLPPGFVPHSTYWLVENGTEVVGVSNIRHSLTPALEHEGGSIGYGVRPACRGRGLGKAILRLSLIEARRLGLARVLLTCAKGNTASARVIRSNGGRLVSEEYLAHRHDVVQRYVIALDDDAAAPKSSPRTSDG